MPLSGGIAMGLHWQHNAVQRMGRLIVMAVLMWSSATATAPHVLSQPGGSAVAAPGVTAAFEGCQQTDPYNVEKHPDGSTTYHYKVDGLETTETTPPPGFDVS